MKNFEKIIFLGFNKTGTDGIHRIFLQNNFKSVHGRPAGLCGSDALKIESIKKFEVVSDWCESHISRTALEKLKVEFPNALFILNTRPMIDWLESRMKHYSFWIKTKKRSLKLIRNPHFDPTEISLANADKMIEQRNNFYKNCIEVFSESKNFMIMDIRRKTFFSDIAKKIKREIRHSNKIYNQRSLSEIDIEDQEKILKVREQIYEKYGHLADSSLTTEKEINELLLSFENNLTRKYCFLTTIESDNNSFNELVLMLKSFRKNVLSLEDSTFWVLVNDGGLNEDKVNYLKNNFGPIIVEQKKSLCNFSDFFTGPKTYRKYNAYLYFNKWKEYDRIIHMDSDFIFTEDCEDILSKDKADFSAHISGHDVVPKDIAQYYEKYLNLENQEIKKIALEWRNKINEKKIKSPLVMPNFNSGFISLSHEGFLKIKLNIKESLEKVYLDENAIPGIGVCSWKREQIALTSIAIKEIKNYEISNVQFYGPKIFHLMKDLYGDLHYGGNRVKHLKDSLPELAELEVNRLREEEEFWKNLKIMKSNKVYRLGDILYRRYSWVNERVEILNSQEYRQSLLYSYLSRLENPLNKPEKEFRSVDKSYGIDCGKNFLEAIKESKYKYEKYLKQHDDILYINIRAGDVIDLNKPELFINNKEKLYDQIKTTITRNQSIKKITIVTALHFGDADQNNIKYKYKFSNDSVKKNLVELKSIIEYISKNINKEVDLVGFEENESDIYNIDKDFYILSYAKNVILEEMGGFTQAVLDARRLISKGSIKNQSRPKLAGNTSVQPYVDNNRNVFGFFALCSIHLFQIVEKIKTDLIDDNIKFKKFKLHQKDSDKDIRELVFQEKNNNIDIDIESLKNDDYIIKSNHIYYLGADGNKYKNLVKKWFKPKKEIEVLESLVVDELEINYSNTIAVYYRGTDTVNGRGITHYNIFVDNLKKIINQNQDIKLIYLQTDDSMFRDYCLSSSIGVKVVINPYLKSIYSHQGYHFKTKENKVFHIQKMLASVFLMSKCKYVFCNTSNVSRWINFYRENKEGFFQMRRNNIFPSING